MGCDVGHIHGSDQALLLLWHRLAAVAPIRPLACETPYAMSVALKSKKKKKKTQKLKVYSSTKTILKEKLKGFL